MRELALVVLGWLFGLLTLPMGDAIRRGYRRPEIKRHVWLELDELRVKLVIVAWNVRLTRRRLDRGFLDWAGKHLRHYNGLLSDAPATTRLREATELPAEGIEQLNSLPRDQREGIAFIKYSTPFLSSHIADTAIFSLDVQRRVSEVLMRVDAFNQTVERLDENFRRTFDSSLSPGNRSALDANNDGWWDAAESTATLIVQQIDLLESSLGA
jgi:hypothetical protein